MIIDQQRNFRHRANRRFLILLDDQKLDVCNLVNTLETNREGKVSNTSAFLL